MIGKNCSVNGCLSKVRKKGWCYKHYSRYYRHGDPLEAKWLKHGMGKSPECIIWSSAKQRCVNPKNVAYKNYGGRGITMCDEWKNDFMAFYNYIGPRPNNKLTLDRIDNDGNYEPGNVRWATRSVQVVNKRSHNKSGVKHVYWMQSKWRIKINRGGVSRYYGFFDKLEDARKQVERLKSKGVI